jgi:predicted alpha/beta-fold hydrolase
MPVVQSEFHPPFLLRNGHVQTVLGAFLRRGHRVAFEPERLELTDGDFLDLRWLRRDHDRLAILSHGLEGSAHQGYVRGMAAALANAGWDALAWNFRGCGEEPNRLVRLYHSGATEDLRAVIDHAATHYARVALIGFSLGGNLTLKYLGEAPPHSATVCGVAISAPVDLAASARQLDARWTNRIYLRRFIRSLIAKVEAKAVHFPTEIDASGSRELRTFQEFDDRYTSKLHGFRDAADYWAQASSRQYLPRITVPALLLNALNDPFLAPECFPIPEAQESDCFHLEAPAFGGHLGFLEFAHGLRLRPWFESRIIQFLAEAL